MAPRRPPRATEPRSWPWRTALRFGSWRPFGPASVVTSASISACITCRPVPMARASRPSRMEPAISAIATLTRSGTTNASPVGVSIFSFWYFLVTAVPCRWCLGGRPTPTSRPVWAGDRHLNFYETRDNLRDRPQRPSPQSDDYAWALRTHPSYKGASPRERRAGVWLTWPKVGIGHATLHIRPWPCFD